MSLVSKIHLRPTEEILENIRRYPLTYFWRYIFGLALMSASSFFMFWLWAQGWWGYALYGLGMFLGFYIIFSTWFFNRANVFIVTSERVVDVSRQGWFDEMVSSASYVDIKDVFVRKKGILANILNYGNLTVETRSQQVALEIVKVHQPQKWHCLIMDIKDQFRQKRRLLTREAIYAGFVNIIPELSEEELREMGNLIDKQLNSFSS